MLIPPSNTMIVYSSVCEEAYQSWPLYGGYIPGLLWGGAVMILAGIMAKKRGYRAEQRVPVKVALKTFSQAIPKAFTYRNRNQRYPWWYLHSNRRFCYRSSICNSIITYI